MVTFTLDNFPLVSENRRLEPGRCGGRWHLSKAYAYVKAAMIVQFIIQRPRGHVPYKEFVAHIRVVTSKDGTNILKPIFDALEEARVIENDRGLRTLLLVKLNRKKGEGESLKIKIKGLKYG